MLRTEGIIMTNGNTMKSLEGGGAYKYMGLLEEDKIKHKHVKNETT